MCNECPHRDSGYCGCYDLFLSGKNGAYEPVYECLVPDENKD